MSGCRSEAGRLPNSQTHNEETTVAKSSVCSRNSENVCVSGVKPETSGVCDQLAVVDQVRWSLTSQRLKISRLECYIISWRINLPACTPQSHWWKISRLERYIISWRINLPVCTPQSHWWKISRLECYIISWRINLPAYVLFDRSSMSSVMTWWWRTSKSSTLTPTSDDATEHCTVPTHVDSVLSAFRPFRLSCDPSVTCLDAQMMYFSRLYFYRIFLYLVGWLCYLRVGVLSDQCSVLVSVISDISCFDFVTYADLTVSLPYGRQNPLVYCCIAFEEIGKIWHNLAEISGRLCWYKFCNISTYWISLSSEDRFHQTLTDCQSWLDRPIWRKFAHLRFSNIYLTINLT